MSATMQPAATTAMDPRWLFAGLLGEREAALLVDDAGFVIGGAWHGADGRDVSADVSAVLSGVSDEALRATRHLAIGAWRTIVFETAAATVALAPVNGGSQRRALLLVAASPETPLGAFHRTVARCAERALAWLAWDGGA